MSKEISNPKVEVPTGTEMTDLNILTDILASVKCMVANYAVVLNEASNDIIYQLVKDIFDETTEIQRALFDMMFENGWYIVEVAEQNKITQKYNQFNNQMGEMV